MVRIEDERVGGVHIALRIDLRREKEVKSAQAHLGALPPLSTLAVSLVSEIERW